MNSFAFISICFPGGSDSKELACSAGDLGLISGLRRSPGEGKGYPLQRGHKESDTTERLSLSVSTALLRNKYVIL